MRSNLFWLSDEQWIAIQPLLPTDVRGKERVDGRRVISEIIFVIKSGCRWWVSDLLTPFHSGLDFGGKIDLR